jgi:hypothetical protein
MSTAASSNHNGAGASSTQTPEGAPHQSPPRVPSPPQELEQVLVQDWDEEPEEDKATAEEEEFITIQQEIERLVECTQLLKMLMVTCSTLTGNEQGS